MVFTCVFTFAVPLTLVQKLMGPYLVFLSSTVNGYEGTGRSLSLKLIKQLRERSIAGKNGMGASAKKLYVWSCCCSPEAVRRWVCEGR